MRMLQLKCPSCGGVLEVEDSLDKFYCKYCGTKIILAEQSDQLIKAKVDMAKMSHEERMYTLQIQEERRKERESTLVTFCVIIFCCILIYLLYSCSVRME